MITNIESEEIFESNMYLGGEYATDMPPLWQLVKLGDIAIFSQGIQVPIERQSTIPLHGYTRFIRIVDYMQDNNDIRYINESNMKKAFVKDNDIVMVRYGTPGKVGRGIDGVIANNLFQVIPNSDCDKNFLFYCLSSSVYQKAISALASSTTMPAINFKTLSTIIIALPPMAEQLAIAKAMDILCDSVSTNRKCLEQAERMQTILSDSLVQGKILVNSIMSSLGEGE